MASSILERTTDLCVNQFSVRETWYPRYLYGESGWRARRGDMTARRGDMTKMCPSRYLLYLVPWARRTLEL